MNELNYVESNRESWNNRVESHVGSEFYGMEEFMSGKSSLKDTELELLGDVTGKSILHLQCHFGQDTISLSRMGATVTGSDFSDKAIDQAKWITSELGLDTEFICCNIYDLPQHLDQKFDIVYTSYGTIGWLHDLKTWAELIAHFLKPGGKFVFVEFHPVVWMYDNDFDKVEYRYFQSDPIIETQTGTYADKNSEINIKDISWNHGIGEVVTHLLNAGLRLDKMSEYDYANYNCFNHCEEYEPGRFRIKYFGDKIPMMYSLVCEK